MISAIFNTIGQAVTGFAGVVISAATSAMDAFFAEGALTPLGILLLVASGVGLVYWSFRMIRGLVRTH